MTLSTKLTLLCLLLANVAMQGAPKVSLTSVSAPLRTAVEVPVSLSSDDEQAVAAEISIPLPEGVTYVAGSARATSSRLVNHAVSASVKDDRLVIVLFDFSLRPIPAGEGEILTFSLNTGKQPAVYTLMPTVRLSDAKGSAVACEAQSATLTALGARTAISQSVTDFGRVPIRGTYTRSLTISNTGTSTLTVSDITSQATDLSFSPTGFTVAPGSSQSIKLTYAPVDYADSVSIPFTIYSDAVNPRQQGVVKAVPYSVNEVRVQRASGISGQEVTVSVYMNNMEPITGAEMTFTLPDALKYVKGSVRPGSRASALMATEGIDGNKVRLILFGLGNTPVEGDDGELLTFRVLLDGRNRYNYITPEKVRLSNAKGRDMTSRVYGSSVSIDYPIISGNDRLDFGKVPCTQQNVAVYTVSNRGYSPLTVDRVLFLSEGFEVLTSMPLTVEAGSSAELRVAVDSREPGDFSTTMNIYSDDPDSKLKSVAVGGTAYSPNRLVFTGMPSEDEKSFKVSAELVNHSPIAAMQFDVQTEAGVTLSSSDLQLSGRKGTHMGTVSKVADNRYRVVIFSFSNDAFSGNTGEAFTLTHRSSGSVAGKKFTFSNVRLSTPKAQNVLSPDFIDTTLVAEPYVRATGIEVTPTETYKGILYVLIGDTVQFTATVLPVNATDRTVSWTHTGDCFALDRNGRLQALSKGAGTVTATNSAGQTATVLVRVEETVGVEGTEVQAFSVLTEGQRITVLHPDSDASVRLFTVSGLAVPASEKAPDRTIFTVPSRGVYLVTCSGRTLKIRI